MQLKIDLNADLGESYGAYRYGADEALIPLVSSVNIACGWHGGDPAAMRSAAALAAKHHVAIGAHPGYPDLAGFGRRAMALSPKEVTDGLLYQIGALDGICRAEGVCVRYVKPHGALYNAAAKEETLAEAVAEAIRLYDPALVLLCPANSAMERAAKNVGVRAAREFFADRAYQNDGSLVPRSLPNAVITDEAAVCARVKTAVQTQTVLSVDGNPVSLPFDSICLHGDNPKAVRLAGSIRAALAEADVRITSFV